MASVVRATVPPSNFHSPRRYVTCDAATLGLASGSTSPQQPLHRPRFVSASARTPPAVGSPLVLTSMSPRSTLMGVVSSPTPVNRSVRFASTGCSSPAARPPPQKITRSMTSRSPSPLGSTNVPIPEAAVVTIESLQEGVRPVTRSVSVSPRFDCQMGLSAGSQSPPTLERQGLRCYSSGIRLTGWSSPSASPKLIVTDGAMPKGVDSSIKSVASRGYSVEAPILKGSGLVEEAASFSNGSAQTTAPPTADASCKSSSSRSSPGVAARVARITSGTTAPVRPEALILDLLQDRDVLKRQVIKCFRSIDAVSDGLDVNGLRRFKGHFLESLKLPYQVFMNFEQEAMRFDFSGSGRLDVTEVYKLVKFHLREWHRRYCSNGSMSTTAIPMKSLQQAGYTVTKKLGEGSQAVAMLATSTAGQKVCIKAFQKAKLNDSSLNEMKEEFEVMQLLSSDRVAQPFEFFQDGLCYYMVSEACHGGDFTTLLQRARSQGVNITEDWWREIFRQCFEALTFMHEQAIMHCDIKEPNMMLRTTDFHRPEVVVIDFGVAKVMVADSVAICGTPGYIPPETWEHGKWFPRGDVFSLGVTMMQLVTNKVPPSGLRHINTPGGIFIEGCLTVPDIAKATCQRMPPFHLVPPQFPELRRFIQGPLQKSMTARPTPAQALIGPWLKQSRSTRGGSVFGQEESTPRSQSVQAQRRVARKVNPRHDFATFGITKSFLADMDGEDEDEQDLNIQALREVTKAYEAAQDATAAKVASADAASTDEPGEASVVVASDAAELGRSSATPPAPLPSTAAAAAISAAAADTAQRMRRGGIEGQGLDMKQAMVVRRSSTESNDRSSITAKPAASAVAYGAAAVAASKALGVSGIGGAAPAVQWSSVAAPSVARAPASPVMLAASQVTALPKGHFRSMIPAATHGYPAYR